MHLSYTFALRRVSELAEHAMAAPTHADPIDDEDPGPALLLAVDDGIYLLSNGDPQLPPSAEQPPHSQIRVAFSHEAPSMAIPGVYPDSTHADFTTSVEARAAAQAVDSLDCFIAPLPLTDTNDGPALIEVIRSGTAHGHRLLRMTFDRDGDNPPTLTTE